MQVPIIAVNGPTASGKSALAVEIATLIVNQGLTAEVVNADSMLVYTGMDIGTAKPTMEEQGGIPHHLIDIFPVTQTATVAEFQQLARTTINQVRARGAVPILVGGSALYMRAILDVFEFPGTDPEIRAKWQAELERIGSAQLHQKLISLAPGVAADILPGNGRRIVRALEVIELTGDYTPRLPSWEYALENVFSWGLELSRELMDERIAARVELMWQAGLVDEVRELEKIGLRDGLTASRALGYRQVLAMLAGEITEEEAKAQTISATRRFARKQLGWFRRDHRIKWLSAADPVNPSLIVEGSMG